MMSRPICSLRNVPGVSLTQLKRSINISARGVSSRLLCNFIIELFKFF